VKLPATTQKLRGGYYTPPPIARFLAAWAIRSAGDMVLEPSCGDGAFLAAAAETLAERGAGPSAIRRLIHGVEIDEEEAEKAARRLAPLDAASSLPIWVGDFFQYCEQHLLSELRFDAIIGNPPFIRYQNFQEDHRTVAFRLMKHAGLRPTRLTNAWVPFMVASTLLLNPGGGRLAMVIPAELMQVGYAAELRQFLTECYSKITLLTFRKLVFEGIQQEVVLFLGERDGHDHTGIRTVELDELADLPDYLEERPASDPPKEMDHSTEKWTQYYLDRKELGLLRALRDDARLTAARKVLSVDVGIVTGLNEFFVLTQEQAAARQLLEYTVPIVTRSAHLRGLIFAEQDLRENIEKQLPSRLLNLPEAPLDRLSVAARNYVLTGMRQGFHQGYKCRIREHWYAVPSIWTPDAFMLRQVHGYPKLVLNTTPATSTDTIHRVRLTSELRPKAIVAAFLNSLTFALSEVIGRSYGGGVLELEPNEAETLLLPLQGIGGLDFDRLNDLVLKGDIESALDLNDAILLIGSLGLTERETATLRGAWHKLRDRRINRRFHQIIRKGSCIESRTDHQANQPQLVCGLSVQAAGRAARAGSARPGAYLSRRAISQLARGTRHAR